MEWQFANRLSFTSTESRDTPVKSSSTPSSAAGDGEWTTRTFVAVPVECKGNVIQWLFAGRLDTLPAFYEQINEEKRTRKRKETTKKLSFFLQKSLSWRIRVSVPVLSACEAGALLCELIPQNISHLWVDLEIYMIHIMVSSRSPSALMR